MGHLYESEVKWRWKRILHLGEKRGVDRDREQQRRQKQRGKTGIDGGLTKEWYGSLSVCELCCAWCSIDCWAQTVTHMTCLMWASPYYSALCGAATLSGVTMMCKAAVAKRANYKDGQSTYAPQSWQLDISIHHSEWMWGGDRWENRERREEKKKRNKVLFFFQSSCCILPTQLLWFARCHSPGLLVLLKTVKQGWTWW